MNLSAFELKAAQDHLALFGVCHTEESDGLLDGTILLLGPKEPGFWANLTQSPEFLDGAPDPVDRWSHRVITTLANRFNGTALFPFGKPVRPFISWALRSGSAWSSPIGLLVHETAGLMISYRGAILIPESVPLPVPNVRPCETCNKPCESACPVDAFSTGFYDVDTCREHIGASKENTCMSKGCLARTACPISQTYGRATAQSAYHMGVFHKLAKK